jgi:DNA topoisomerase IB
MRLRRSHCDEAGITRRRRGKGFSYAYANGRPVKDRRTLERIRALAVPPAWTDVWICPWPNGHIQALGTDDAGRRQYRYHDDWRLHRDRQKFERVLDFAAALPEIRAAVERDLSKDDLCRERVLAATVRLLDVGLFRVGGVAYAEENETFGVTSLRKEHVRIRKGAIVFCYPAKGSIERTVEIRDDKVRKVVDSLRRRRNGNGNGNGNGQLFAYKEDDRRVDVRAEDTNAYIKEAAGGDDFSAKDFRTWSATVLTAAALAENGAPETEREAKHAVVSAIAEAADYLGNTPAVARSAYIDPRIIDRFEDGQTIAEWLPRLPKVETLSESSTRNRGLRRTVEEAVIDLINDAATGAKAGAA